jgi:hypothetical protein
MEPPQELRHPPSPGAQGKVAEVPDRIIRADDRVPGLDKGLVHSRHGCEWAPEQAKRAAVAEVRVSGEEHGQGSRPASSLSYQRHAVSGRAQESFT